MGKAFINDTTITNIANAVRSKFGLTGTLKLSDMLTALHGVKKPGSYVWSKSTGGMTWTQSNITSGDFNSVYYGNNIWVAGSGDGLWHSTDGKTWTQSNVTNGSVKSVYYSNGIWVSGSGNGLYYSTDGKTWTQSNIASDSFHSVYSVYYGNGTWVAGSNSGLYYSTDGKNWTQSNITSGYFYSVYYANGIWGAGLYYSESTFSYIVGDNESDYPDKTVRDGYYYEKVLPTSNPFVPEIEV